MSGRQYSTLLASFRSAITTVVDMPQCNFLLQQIFTECLVQDMPLERGIGIRKEIINFLLSFFRNNLLMGKMQGKGIVSGGGG